MLPILAAFAASPTALPNSVAPGPADSVYVWGRGERTARSLDDGAIRETVLAPWSLSDGWAIDGAHVSRHGAIVAALDAEPSGVAVAGDTAWVRVKDGLLRVRAGQAPELVAPGQVSGFAPLGLGVAVVRRRGTTLFGADGQKSCFSGGRPHAMVATPDGRTLLTVDRDGLAVLDDQCRLVAGAPLGGDALGFLDAARLAVLDGDDIHVLAWPSLDLLHDTPPTVDARWAVAQGPGGPVLFHGRDVYDPQTGARATLPLGAMVLREEGLAIVSDGAQVRVLDLGGHELRTLAVGLDGAPRSVAIDGERLAVTDGFGVVLVLPDGSADRWTLDAPVSRLVLRAEGVEARTNDGARLLLRSGKAAPEPTFNRADPEELRRSDGSPVRLLWGDASTPRAIHAASGPAQVFDVDTLATLGPEIPQWFERASLSPDGRLLVGVAEGHRARAFEVATGRELWSLEVDRAARIVVYGTFVVVERGRESRLLDPSTGAEVWTVGPPDSEVRKNRDALAIASQGALWRSDTKKGALPKWSGTVPRLATPTRGDGIATRTESASKATAPAKSTPLDWPATATAGGATARLHRLRPGRNLATKAGQHSIPLDDTPTVVLYGPGAELPSTALRGMAVLAILTDGVRPAGRYPSVSASPELDRRLRLGPKPGAVLVSASGRELARGTAEEVLSLAERAGVEEQGARPDGALEPEWTLRAPAPVESVVLLGDGAVVIATEGGFAVVSPEGTVRWTSADELAFAQGDTVVTAPGDRIEARGASDGALRWRRSATRAVPQGDHVLLDARASSAVDLLKGAPQEALLGRIVPVRGELWFVVPGGWCRRGGPCLRHDPATSVTLGDGPAWIEDRQLRRGRLCAPGFVRVLQLDATRAVAQLGNEAGPWVVYSGGRRLGPLLGYGAVAAAGGGVVVIARGTEVRSYRVP